MIKYLMTALPLTLTVIVTYIITGDWAGLLELIAVPLQHILQLF